jgi:hypothetical protein
MKESAVLFAGVLCLFFIGCDGDSRCTVCPDGAGSWYFNSFESYEDTVGWLGPPAQCLWTILHRSVGTSRFMSLAVAIIRGHGSSSQRTAPPDSML